jgi:DNA replication and repair protein RecF
MPVLNRIKVDNFRNLKTVDVALQPGVNLFYGDNGSGKTSFLEAVHVLSVGKSFRTARVDPLLADGSNQFLIYGELDSGDRIGLVRQLASAPALRLNTETQTSWKDVASLLPLQVLNSESFLLVEGGAGVKRRFMDWAMFHVEHSYLELWRSYRRILQHRNALLKLHAKDIFNQLDIWDVELAKVGEHIHLHREILFQKFLPVLYGTVSDLLPSPPVSVEYKKGWEQDVGLRQALYQSRQKDIRYRVTGCGPHRADLLLTCDSSPVSEFLSRGQIKLLACAIKISMSKHLSSIKIDKGITSHATIFLIDDLAAELDEYSSHSVLAALQKTNDQCIFTAITCEALSWVAELTQTSGKFHVEHGKIQAI